MVAALPAAIRRQSMTEPAALSAAAPASSSSPLPSSLPSALPKAASPPPPASEAPDDGAAPDDLASLSKEDLIRSLREARRELAAAKASTSAPTPPRSAESQRRESVLFMRLTAKEQEVQECLRQLEEVRSSMGAGLRGLLLDPVAAAMFARLRSELVALKAQVEKGQEEALAWKFTPDSTTGKRLMAKCRSLIAENEELGKAVESGRLAQLEGELALLKQHKDELHKGQAEVEDLVADLDEDCEGLQATVVTLQRELEAARAENARLKDLLGPQAEEAGPGCSGDNGVEDADDGDDGDGDDGQDRTTLVSPVDALCQDGAPPLRDVETEEEAGSVAAKLPRLDATASAPKRTANGSPDLNGLCAR